MQDTENQVGRNKKQGFNLKKKKRKQKLTTTTQVRGEKDKGKTDKRRK